MSPIKKEAKEPTCRSTALTNAHIFLYTTLIGSSFSSSLGSASLGRT